MCLNLHLLLASSGSLQEWCANLFQEVLLAGGVSLISPSADSCSEELEVEVSEWGGGSPGGSGSALGLDSPSIILGNNNRVGAIQA